MKWLSAILLSLLLRSPVQAQLPYIQWQKCFGGTLPDAASKGQATSDGGYVLAGSTLSNNGDITLNHGGTDVWVIKTDANGILQWQKTFGGTDTESAIAIEQTSDGGYVVLASTQSPNNGDVSGHHGLLDIWVLRLTAAGNLLWQKCLGGTGSDYGESLRLNPDGSIILSGQTNSNDGDVIGNHGSRDAWVVKLDASGSLQWARCYGGSTHEGETAITLSNDGGYVLVANATSSDGDVTPGPGGGDIWVVKLDASGAIQWQKAYGGSFGERPYAVTVSLAGNLLIAGLTVSNNGHVTGNHGGTDAWVISLDPSGVLQWQKCLGGTGFDAAHDIRNAMGGGYILTGRTNSSDGDLCRNAGGADYWIVYLRTDGTMQWKRSFGGSSEDLSYSVSATTDGGYLMAGGTSSNDGDVSNNHGSRDVWAVKILLGNPTQPSISINTPAITSCWGRNLQFVATTQGGGDNPVYTWQVNGSQVGTNNDSLNINNLNNGDTVRCIITSSDRCLSIPSDTSNYIRITIDPALSPNNFLPPDFTKCGYDVFLLKPIAVFATYLWSDSSSGSSLEVINPASYWLEVTDHQGCKGRDTIVIDPKNDCPKGVFIPTAFTPNGDGRNDLFGPLVYERLRRFEFSVFNRWGERVFYSTDPSKKWNGDVSRKDQKSSVFVWLLNYQVEGQPSRLEKGTVAVIR